MHIFSIVHDKLVITILTNILYILTLILYRTKRVWGGRQAELLVAQQAYALQTDEHKAMPPAELQTLVQDLLKCSPYYADAVSNRMFHI